MNPVVNQKLSGTVWGQKSVEEPTVFRPLGGAGVRAHRNNLPVDSKRSGPTGTYELAFPSKVAPLDMISYTHSEYYDAILFPIAGGIDHNVSPVLFRRGVRLSTTSAVSQLSTYECMLCYLLDGASDPSADSQVRDAAIEVRGQLETLAGDLPRNHLRDIFEAKIRHLSELCGSVTQSKSVSDPDWVTKLIRVGWDT